MEPYSSEQEQVEAIRKWWQENGKAIIAGLVLGIGALFGWRGYQAYLTQQAEEASHRFQQMISKLVDNSPLEAAALGQRLVEDHAKSSYAALSALVLAKLAVETGDLPAARGHLQWVLDNSRDPEIRFTARTRLARVLLDQGDGEGAWTLLGAGEQPTLASFHELRGDVLLARGKPEEARAEYLRALALVEAADGDPELVQLKLDDLGRAPPGGEIQP